MKKILFIAGARPNFMKISALTRAAFAMKNKFDIHLIHTGQHYDDALSSIFFNEFNLPEPRANLGIGSMERGAQIKAVAQALLPYLSEIKPDIVVVVGDVNSTLGATMAAGIFSCPLVHVEAGLRSFNWRMPEEANRVATDHLSDLLFASEEAALQNLKNEGVDMNRCIWRAM